MNLITEPVKVLGTLLKNGYRWARDMRDQTQ